MVNANRISVTVLVCLLGCLTLGAAQAQTLDYSALTYWKSVQASAQVTSVSLSPDRKKLAAGMNGKVIVWNDKLEEIKTLSAADNRNPEGQADDPLRELPAQDRWMIQSSFSPDSKLIAAACSDGTVRLWDLETGAETICNDSKLITGDWKTRSHEGAVRSVAFSPDGTKIVSGGDDKAVKIWDVQSGKILHQADGHLYKVMSVAFSTDGSTITSLGTQRTGRASGEFKMWDSKSGELTQSVTVDNFSPTSATLSPDGRVAVCSGEENGYEVVKFWNAGTGEYVRSTERNSMWGGKGAITFSPDSQIVAAATEPIMAWVDPQKGTNRRASRIGIWNVKSGKSLVTLPDTTAAEILPNATRAMAIANNNRAFAFACEDNTIQIWAVP